MKEIIITTKSMNIWQWVLYMLATFIILTKTNNILFAILGMLVTFISGTLFGLRLALDKGEIKKYDEIN